MLSFDAPCVWVGGASGAPFEVGTSAARGEVRFAWGR